MRVVGLLLVSALMVVPVATAQQLTRRFRSTLLLAMVSASRSRWPACCSRSTSTSRPARASWSSRSSASWRCRRAAGCSRDAVRRPWISSLGTSSSRASPRGARLADHAGEPHEHVHDEQCGHQAVRHGDHVDYLHEGHRHAVHADHYDEH